MPDDFVQSPVDVTLGGQQFKLSPLTDGDIVELDRWVQAECISAAQACVSENASQADYDRVVGAACKASIGLCSSFGEGRRALLTDRGYARLTWTGLRSLSPTLTEQKVRLLLKSATVAERRALVTAYQVVNGLLPQNGQEAKPDPPGPG